MADSDHGAVMSRDDVGYELVNEVHPLVADRIARIVADTFDIVDLERVLEVREERAVTRRREAVRMRELQDAPRHRAPIASSMCRTHGTQRARLLHSMARIRLVACGQRLDARIGRSPPRVQVLGSFNIPS